MRLFIAIELPESSILQLTVLTDRLKRAVPDPQERCRWVLPNQMHLTLKFLGETLPELETPLKERLNSVAQKHRTFSLTFGKAGQFNHGQELKVLWLGAENGSKDLCLLANELEIACASIGFSKEVRTFHPHLTLARAKHPVPARLVEEMLQKTALPPLTPISVKNISLIQSQLSAKGPRYTTLHRSPLNEGNSLNKPSVLQEPPNSV